MSTIQSGDPKVAETSQRASLRLPYAAHAGNPSTVGLAGKLGISDGLVDAFADVFAAMAVTEPIVRRPPAQTTSTRDSEPETPDENDVQDEPASGSSSEAAAYRIADDAAVRQSDVPVIENGIDHDVPVAVAVTDQGTDESFARGDRSAKPDEQPETPDEKTVDARPTDEAETVLKSDGLPANSSVELSKDSAAATEVKPATETIPIKPVAETVKRSQSVESQDGLTRTDETLGFTSQATDQDAAGDDRHDRRSREHSLRNGAPGKRSTGLDAASPPSSANPSNDPVSSSGPAAESMRNVSDAIEASSPAIQNTVKATQVVAATSATLTPTVKSSTTASAPGRTSETGGPPTLDGRGGNLRSGSGSEVGKPGTADQTSRTGDLIARAKLVQRVSKAFQHFGNEGGSIRLKLAPAELGTVRVEMQVKDKQVQARVVAESETTAEMLRQQLPELRSRLEAQGMRVDRLSVQHDAADDEQRFAQQQFAGEHSSQDSSQGWQDRRPAAPPSSRNVTTQRSSDAEVSHADQAPGIVSAGNRGIDILH